MRNSQIVVVFFFVMFVNIIISNMAYSEINSMAEIPFDMKFVESDHGNYLLSENGRFVIKGKMYDLWTGKEIKTITDLQKLSKVDLREMGVNLENWSVPVINDVNNKSEVIVFLDIANIRQSRQIMDYIKDNIHQSNLYVFPLASKENGLDFLKNIYCAGVEERVQILEDLLMGKRVKESDCTVDTYLKIKNIVQLIQVKRLPAFITRDHKLVYSETEIFGN